MVYKYVIDKIPPSNNRYIGRNNRFAYAEQKAKWETLIKYCCVPKPQHPIVHSKVTLMYYFKDKIRRDPDNFSGKFILDGLRKCGIIYDDSFSNIDLVLRAGYDKVHPRTEITIEVIEK